MEQDTEYRDISIIYRDIKLQAKVEMSSIVSEFFKHKLKSFSDRFKELAN
jgi:hypothetical protein